MFEYLCMGDTLCYEQVDVKLSQDKELSQQLKHQIKLDMKQFLEPIRLKLGQFEQELKDR